MVEQTPRGQEVRGTSGAGPFDLCLSLSITLKQVLQGGATLVIFLKRRCLAEMLGANLNFLKNKI